VTGGRCGHVTKMASMMTWLPLVRAAAVGWVPLSANPMSMSAPAAPEARTGLSGVSADARLRINISGQRFEAWRRDDVIVTSQQVSVA